MGRQKGFYKGGFVENKEQKLKSTAEDAEEEL